MTCTICSGTDIIKEVKPSREGRELTLLRCASCRHIAQPMSEYQDMYTTGEFTLKARDTGPEPDADKIRQLDRKAFERFERYKGYFAEASSVVEVGSSIGSFVHLLRLAGHDALGIEPDPVYARFSEKQYGFHQAAQLFEDFEADRQHDMICSFHVIEHVRDPRAFVAKAFGVLKQKGRLLIECPSYEVHSFGDMTQTIWQPHIHYFSLASIYTLLSPWFRLIDYGYTGSALYVVGEKSSEASFSKPLFGKLASLGGRVFFLNRCLPRIPFGKKIPARQLLIQAMIEKGRFRHLARKIWAFGRYKLREGLYLRGERGKGSRTVVHITLFKGWGHNAGDLVLSKMVRDSFNRLLNPFAWLLRAVSSKVDERLMSEINQSDLLIVGGGGLLLPDSNPNAVSGWQWAVSRDQIESIRVPLVVFAIGYNYFRGQEPNAFFVDNLKVLIEKSTFFGLRNKGSICAINELTDKLFADKICYQPCPTTLIRKLHPELPPKPWKRKVALNMAFDRYALRFGENQEHILMQIGIAARAIVEKGYELYYVSHILDDRKFEIVLDRLRVPFHSVRLQYQFPMQMVHFYNDMDLVIGMRGHAQMIPFGLNTPIISLGTHDKMRWFLDDIQATDWHLDLLKDIDTLGQRLLKQFETILEQKREDTLRRLLNAQEELYRVTCENLSNLRHIINSGSPD